jgi:indolepyruvate ferredoxin oxidoreductase
VERGVGFPGDDLLHHRIDAVTSPGHNVYFDADKLANTLFGTHLAANFIVVGAAFQAGLIPLSVESIERAITVNGTAPAMNIQAFRVGRQMVIDPGWAAVCQLRLLQPTSAGTCA